MQYSQVIPLALLVFAVGCGHMETQDCSPSETTREPVIHTSEDAPGVNPVPELAGRPQIPRKEAALEKKCPIQAHDSDRREIPERVGRE